MKFFDSLILETEKLISLLPKKEFEPCKPWCDAGQAQVIMRRDTAYELEGVGFNLVTSDNISDSIVVVGDDLNEIKDSCRFTRICFIQIEDSDDDQKAYNLIKKIDYVKYHTFPDGYMMRSTSRSHKEAVRVSTQALKDGADFRKIGSLLIEKYKEIPAVIGVKVIFITAKEADYNEAERIAEKNYAITETLNHVMNSVNFDCDTCNLKAICDEVEGMKELHFNKTDK
jgi:CO dehydrogenase/acetyl-CoA synthase beta subunit